MLYSPKSQAVHPHLTNPFPFLSNCIVANSHEVKNACRPLLASASIEKFEWKPGEPFKTTVWILNDSPKASVPLGVDVSLVEADKKLSLGHWDFTGEQANKNKKGPEFSGTIPDWHSGIFKLVVEVTEHPELSSEYQFILKQ